MKPDDLLDGLVSRFNAELPENATQEDIEYGCFGGVDEGGEHSSIATKCRYFEKSIITVQQKVCTTIKHWVDNFFQDFATDSILQSDVLDFASQLKHFEQFRCVGEELEVSMQRQVHLSVFTMGWDSI